MPVLTSCYGRWRKFPQGCIRAAVSLKVPSQNAFDIRIAPFAPTLELVEGSKSGAMDNAEYARRYLLLLQSRKNAFKAADRLKKMDIEGKTVVLLCWEANGFCHRRILAQWLNAGWEMDVPELDIDCK